MSDSSDVVLSVVRDGFSTLSSIAEELHRRRAFTTGKSRRQVRTILQALRAAGKLRFVGNKWLVADHVSVSEVNEEQRKRESLQWLS